MYVTFVFVIVDTLAHMFDLNLPQHLIKGLIMNIYIDRKWGHTGIFRCATCMGEYHDSRRPFQLQVVGGKFGP